MSAAEFDDNTPGWDAIHDALARLYGDEEACHYAPTVSPLLGGPDPLHGVSVYRRAAPIPHYHYITFGFSDLFGEGEAGGEFSGFGFELTFRLAAGETNDDPPLWPVGLMQNLAKYVFRTGNGLEAGHTLDCQGPIALDTGTELGFLAFTTDSELGTLTTPLGRLDFLQMVGLCAEEYEAIQHWETERFLSLLQRRYPLLVTDLLRGSILRDPETAAAVEQGIAAEGSSQTCVYAMVNHAAQSGDDVRWRLSANVVADLLLMFDRQLAHGQPCAVLGEQRITHFAPAERDAARIDENELTLELSPALREEMRRTLRIERGEYRWSALPHFVLEVVPTEIKDQAGNLVAVFG